MKIELSQADLLRAKVLLAGIKNGYPKVLTRAINKSLTGARTDAVDEIAKDLNLTKTRIRKDFGEPKKATWSDLTGRLDCYGKPVPLDHFIGTRATATKGVSVKVKKNSKRAMIRYAFERGGLVFRREWKGPRKPKDPRIKYGALPKKFRLKIQRLTGPRIEDIYDDLMPEVQARVGARLLKNFDHELEFELSKLK